MRPGTPELVAALSESMDVTFSADLMYNDQIVGEGLEIAQPDVKFDGSDNIEGSGSATIVWTDDHGLSKVPYEPGDVLAPFGARLILYVTISAGDFSERVQIGDFTITAVPEAQDARFYWGDRVLSMGSRISVDLADRMIEVQRDRFLKLSQPTYMESVYQEMQHLTGFQLTRTVGDAPIRRAVTYEEDRVDGLAQLADIIGGTPFMNWDGTLSVRPYEPGAPVARLTKGTYGTIHQVGAALSAEQVYNGVIIRTEDGDQQQILAELWITEGPLRATPDGGDRTPYHRVPRFYSNPQITTRAQAVEAAPGLLERYSAPRAAQLEVQCLLNPLLELGDVVTVDDDGIVWTIRITEISPTSTPYMTVKGDVIDRVFT